jgi:hypothetical protein
MGSIVNLTATAADREAIAAEQARLRAHEDAEQERYLRAWREEHPEAVQRRRRFLRPWQHAA